MITVQSPTPVEIPAGSSTLAAELVVPPRPHGLVIFAHGTGGARVSARNHQVAESLQMRGFATLLPDLLTPQEESVDVYTCRYRFDVLRLATRIEHATAWARTTAELCGLRIGYFGAGTGAAGALIAAAARPMDVGAVVSRSGRPDLAGIALQRVKAPTLLIVGSADVDVIELNKDAMRRMTAMTRLEQIPGATHLFEEPGTFEEAERLAGDWFALYLRRH